MWRHNPSAVPPRRHPLLLAVMAGILLLAAWWLLRPHGPTYQGRDVRGWLLFQERQSYFSIGHSSYAFAVKPDVVAALRAMGTNAFPPLVEEAFHREETKRQKLLGWLKENCDPLVQRLPEEVAGWFLAGSDINILAEDAISELQPPATVLFPLITNRLDGPDGDIARRLLLWVADDRETAARLLIPFLSQTNDLIPRMLSRLGPAARVAIPKLMAGFDSTNIYVRLQTAACLGAIGPEASNALPVLRAAFTVETNQFRRSFIAMNALRIGAPEFWAENELRRVLAGTDQRLRYDMVDRLTSWTNVSPLPERELETLARCDACDAWPPVSSATPVAALAIDVLYNANLDRSRIMQVLADCIWSKNLYVRADALDHMLEFKPSNAPAFAGLTNTLAKPQTRTFDGSYSYDRLVARLVKLVPVNPQAQQALDELRITPADVAEVEARIADRALLERSTAY